MIGKANDPPHALPLIAPPRADEFLSSWLTRIARDYCMPPRSLLTHMVFRRHLWTVWTKR